MLKYILAACLNDLQKTIIRVIARKESLFHCFKDHKGKALALLAEEVKWIGLKN
jgi:hypothetical protein